jgi:hypothetical protein
MVHPDQIFKIVLDTLSRETEPDFRKFVVGSHVAKWFIAADFVTDAPDRPNNSFAFTVFPYNAYFEQIQAEIRAASARDIKEVKTVSQNMLRYLRASQRFSFCFISEKNPEWAPDVAAARQAIDETLGMMRRWRDADRQSDVIKRFEALREEARANSFNAKLFGHMVLMNALAAVVACLLVKHGAPEIIGWFPDRDKMTSAYKAIALELFSNNLSALCQTMGLDQTRLKVAIGIPGPSNDAEKGLWYDDLIRVPDYLAGATAAWDIKGNLLPTNSPKFAEIIRQVLADNPNIALVRLALNDRGLQASRLILSRKPITSMHLSKTAR